MPMSRSEVGTSVTSAPSMNSSPASAERKPATRLSRVVLPQPEGPSSVMNSPRCILSEASRNATVSPKRLVTPSRRTAMSALGIRSAGIVDIQHPAKTEERVGQRQQQRGADDED